MMCWDCRKEIQRIIAAVTITIHGNEYNFHAPCARNIVKNYIIESLHREQAINDKAKEQLSTEQLATKLGYQ